MAFVPFIINYSLNGAKKIIEWDKSKKLIKEERFLRKFQGSQAVRVVSSIKEPEKAINMAECLQILTNLK